MKSWSSANTVIDKLRDLCLSNLYKGIQAHSNAANWLDATKALKPAILWIEQFISKIKSITSHITNHRNQLLKEIELIELSRMQEIERKRIEDNEGYIILNY